MSKTGILVAVAVVGIGATVIPAVLLSNNSDKSELLIPLLSSAAEIREKYKQVKCLNDYFKEIKFNGTKTRNPKFDNIEEFSANSNSCLLVEYYKRNYTKGKWKGEFRLIWSIKDETKGQGLITVTNARTKEDGWLWGNSTAYTLKKDNSKDSWITSNIQEIRESKKDNSSISRLIPQKSDSLPGPLDTKKYWGFNPNLPKICKSGECLKTNNQETKNSYSWNFVGGTGEESVHSWTSQITNWWKNIFAWENFENKIAKVKGKWQENKL